MVSSFVSKSICPPDPSPIGKGIPWTSPNPTPSAHANRHHLQSHISILAPSALDLPPQTKILDPPVCMCVVVYLCNSFAGAYYCGRVGPCQLSLHLGMYPTSVRLQQKLFNSNFHFCREFSQRSHVQYSRFQPVQPNPDT